MPLTSHAAHHSRPPQATVRSVAPRRTRIPQHTEELLAAARARVGHIAALHLAAMAVPTAYRVKAGDTLSSVAHRFYGSASLWPALWWVNRSKIHNPAAVLKGTELALSPWHPRKAWLTRAADAAIPQVRRAPRVSSPGGPAPSVPATTPAPQGGIYSYAQQVFGGEYSCAAAIIVRESGWNVFATNPSSGAYGIPQALPGSKMASAGADWATNGDTQLRWMKGYVDSVYGGACAAWAHWQSAGSY